MTLAALAAALLASGPTAASSATPAAPPYADAVKACDAAKARARAGLPEHQACTADSDCDPWMTWALGCDGVVASRAGAKDLAEALGAACTGIPARRLECAGKIPACAAGRCTFRPRTLRGCDAARSAFRARLETAPTACDADDECVVRRLDGRERAVAARFAREAAREAHAFDDACGDAGGPWPKEGGSFARCASGTCQLADRAARGFAKPRAEDPACFPHALKAERAALADLGTAQVDVSFEVAEDGRIGPFRFSRKLAPAVEAALSRAALSCRWTPGRVSGAARSMWLSIPVRLKG